LPRVSLSVALADCLQAVEERGETIDGCVSKYPHHRKELQALLEVAQALGSGQGKPRPSSTFVLSLKKQLVSGPRGKR